MCEVIQYVPCAGPGCTGQVAQRRGCRPKHACSNACRQRLCQQHKRERVQAACRALWQHWPEPLRACLEAILKRGGPDLAAQTAQTIKAVCGPLGSMPQGTVDELVGDAPTRP